MFWIAWKQRSKKGVTIDLAFGFELNPFRALGKRMKIRKEVKGGFVDE